MAYFAEAPPSFDRVPGKGPSCAASPGRAATAVNEMAKALAYLVLLAAAEIAPGTKRKGPRGRCGSEEVQRGIRTAAAKRKAGWK